MEKAIRYVGSVIEDLVFTNRTSRESDAVGRGCCTRHDVDKGPEMRAGTGTRVGVKKFGC